MHGAIRDDSTTCTHMHTHMHAYSINLRQYIVVSLGSSLTGYKQSKVISKMDAYTVEYEPIACLGLL